MSTYLSSKQLKDVSMMTSIFIGLYLKTVVVLLSVGIKLKQDFNDMNQQWNYRGRKISPQDIYYIFTNTFTNLTLFCEAMLLPSKTLPFYTFANILSIIEFLILFIGIS